MGFGTQEFNAFIDRMKKIRVLSTPDLSQMEDAGEYSRILLDNFSLIGQLAAQNRLLIDEFVKPNINSGESMPDEIRDSLAEFTELLFDVDSFGEIDIQLSNYINNRLMDEEIRITDSDNVNDHVISKAKRVKRDYLIISELTRFSSESTEEFRQSAIENRRALAKYCAKDRFMALNDEARSALLQYSLIGALLFESTLDEKPYEFWEQAISVLEEAEVILNDPFYHDMMPDYDWTSYEFRIYYYGSFLAYSVIPEAIAVKVREYARKAVEFLEHCDREDILNAVNVEQEKDLLLLASVQAGLIPAKEACDSFYKTYEKRDPLDYSIPGINMNLDTPSSYMRIAKVMNMELSPEDRDRYETIEKSVIDYLHHVPKISENYLRCVTLLTNLPMYFREVPGAMTMEEFYLKLLAAVHPPTYIHVNMVADLTESMVRHLFEVNPAQFIGFPGCDTPEKVLESRERITDYAYHAALCHDIGKLFIIDVISMYGRNLLDDEFALIKKHPAVGAQVALENASTAD